MIHTADFITDAEWLRRRVQFNLRELSEFFAWIAVAPASDFTRLAHRIAAAHRLGCYDDRTRDQLAARLVARAEQLRRHEEHAA